MHRAALLLLLCAFCATSVFAGTCTVDGNNKHQVIDGFGFSSAWSGSLPDAKNKALYNTLGMSILRVRIDENGGWNDETANANAAHAYGAIVMGSAWSGPPNLNSNGQAGKGYLLPQNYGAYAQHLQRAVSQFKLDYVSFSNEPDYGEWTNWSADQMLTFLKGYGQSLGTKIVYPESYHFNDQYSDPALNDGSAVGLISIVGGHIYGGGLYTHTNAMSKGKRVWQTEHYIDKAASDINACIKVAQTISDCMNAEMNAYLWWWVAEYDANIKLVDNSGNIYLNGYIMGQFARFVRPGYLRIGTTYSPNSNVFVTAYTGPNNALVIVAVNTGGSSVSQTFSLSNLGTVSSVHLYRTSNNEHMSDLGTVSVSGNSVTINLPGQSVTTAVSTSGGSGGATCASTSGEGVSATLSCAAGQVINSVDFASYGTPTGDCSTGFAKSSCDSNTTVSVMQSQCVAKQTCSVSASNSVFGDPCFGVGKHLAAQVSCVNALSSDNTCGKVNEGSTLTLGCASGKRITKVNFASYGVPQGDCSAPTAGTCHSSSSQSVVEGACLGKNQCAVQATNSLFGDPCSGTPKQLGVSLTCA